MFTNRCSPPRVLTGEADQQPQVLQFECQTFTEDLIACRQKILELGIKDVATESTGIFWKPIHNAWSPMYLRLTVAQAAHVKNVPGRKHQKIVSIRQLKIDTTGVSLQ